MSLGELDHIVFCVKVTDTGRGLKQLLPILILKQA